MEIPYNVSKSKKNAGIFSVEVPHKLCGYHVRQRACPRAMSSWEVWAQGLRGSLENDINHWRFLARRTNKKGGEVSQKTTPSPLCACAFQVSSTLSFLSIRKFRVIKGKQKKHIISLYVSAINFLCGIAYLLLLQSWTFEWLKRFFKIFSWLKAN